MKIHFIYRSAPGDSKSEARPVYFDKKHCLISFIHSVQALPDKNRGDLIFLNDGNIDSSIIEIMETVNSSIETLEGVGNSPSLRFAHHLVLKSNWPEEDLVYFAEDDYLYRNEAFQYMLHAAEDISEAHYFTLYDHPDRYTRNDDVNDGLSKILKSRDLHWRTVESTCQSYGVRLQSFKKDWWIHKIGTSLGTPRGREMFRAVQGIGKYFWKYPKHPVISPIPSYATHMEKKFMAANIDWARVAQKSQKI
ncbi:hypothetical protein [Gracilimonas sp.]|uniref:hypothetical protein n=1 Tax=Gracilimonas sp. TaxID=1974203 RepID=UPI003D11D03C